MASLDIYFAGETSFGWHEVKNDVDVAVITAQCHVIDNDESYKLPIVKILLEGRNVQVKFLNI